MRRNVLETVMGAIVLIVAGYFLFFSYTTAGVGRIDGYRVTAQFDRVDGLGVGSDVRLSGIKVGTVTAQRLDPVTYLAVVEMTIRDDIPLPRDSSAEIVSESLIGGKYLALVPGGSDDMLEAGQEIRYTQSAINLEQLVGRYIFGSDSDAPPPPEDGGFGGGL